MIDPFRSHEEKPVHHCIKCGGGKVYARRWCANEDECAVYNKLDRALYKDMAERNGGDYRAPGIGEGEHIHLGCNHCGYKWTRPPLDAQP